MNDKELVLEVMAKKTWNQKQLADWLHLNRSNVSRYLNKGQKLHPSTKSLLLTFLSKEIK